MSEERASEVVAHLSLPADVEGLHEVVHALSVLYDGPLALEITENVPGFDVVRRIA